MKKRQNFNWAGSDIARYYNILCEAQMHLSSSIKCGSGK